jgi:hypothetical protein
MSSDSLLAGAKPLSTEPVFAHWPEYQRTKATEVIDFMAQLGRPLDPWQQIPLIHGLGQNPAPDLSGWNWAASRCGCWVPRQNGKGDIIMALELAWLFLFKVPLVVHSAHEYKTAQEGFLRIKALIEDNEDLLGRFVQRVWQANGEQGVELTRELKRARLRFMARTRSAGRGFSAPRLILDEAQELDEAMMRAIMFVMSAQVNPQIWFFGTPPDNDEAWIYNIKENGEARKPRMAWFDWGMPTMDVNDVRTQTYLRNPVNHARHNPSVGVNRLNGTGVTLQTIEDELDDMGAGLSFAMERCGMWLPRAETSSDNSISPKVWGQRKKHPELPTDLAISFGVNMRRTHGTIMWAGKLEGKWRVGIAAHQPGTEWMLPRLAELKARYNPVVFTVDAKNEQQVDELKNIGIVLPESRTNLANAKERPQRGDLILPTAGDVATAFGMIVDAANNDEIGHHDEPPLNAAVTVPPRPVGVTGATFDHKNKAGVEVGPATNAALAMWAFRERIDTIVDYDPLGNIW